MTNDSTKTEESPDEWYERERAAFIAWWESDGQQKFGADPTLAAGAGWFARAEKDHTAEEIMRLHREIGWLRGRLVSEKAKHGR